jgi:hypothetical protein
LLGLVLVVGTAAQPDVPNGRPATACDRHDVIVFDELAGSAAAPIVPDERALTLVAFPDSALDPGVLATVDRGARGLDVAENLRFSR